MGKKADKVFPNAKLNMICLSICYIVIGIVLLMFPNLSLKDICYVLGIVVMIVGIINVALYFVRKGYMVPNQFGFSVGVIEVLIGLFAVVRTAEFSFAFSQILALCILVDSVVKMQFSMDLLRMKTPNWWVWLILSVAMLAVAMVILINPFGEGDIRNIFTYVVLAVDGVLNIVTVIYLSHQSKKYHQLMEGQSHSAES